MKYWTPEEMAEGEEFSAEKAEELLEEMVEETTFIRKKNGKYYIPNRRIPWAIRFIMKNKGD